MTIQLKGNITVTACVVDRLSRSLPYLVDLLGEIQASGVDLFLHQQALDTSTSSGRISDGIIFGVVCARLCSQY